MNKKGQFFIFVAVILALVIYVVVSQVNRIEEKILLEDFNELSKNYATEAPKEVNKVLSDNPADPIAAVDNQMDTFTQDFLDYAKTQDPNIGFAYMYYDKNTKEYHVKNYLDPTGGVIETASGSIPSGQEEAVNNIKLDIAGQTFKQNVPISLRTFGKINSGTTTTPDIKIGGVAYKPNLLHDKNYAVIAQSSTGQETRVLEGTF